MRWRCLGRGICWGRTAFQSWGLALTWAPSQLTPVSAIWFPPRGSEIAHYLAVGFSVKSVRTDGHKRIEELCQGGQARPTPEAIAAGRGLVGVPTSTLLLRLPLLGPEKEEAGREETGERVSLALQTVR